jgi:WD40 repeat protein
MAAGTLFTAKHAAVIGIDAYGGGIAALRSAAADARAVAAALARDHGFAAPHLLLDGAADGATILRLLEETLPAAAGADAAVVLYFAGHGVALGDSSEGPEGFLLPQDARAGDESTWLPMARVRAALGRLPCRHLLVVLDCCFAGSFRWASSRSFVPVGRPLYDSQYRRFVRGTAWQVLTSASHQERALDVSPGCRNTRDAAGGGHSPFAAALLRGLAGEADSSRGSHSPDGVITATELHQYVFEELVPREGRSWQTPGIWPLKSENTGEFVFVAPGREVRTRPDPPLDDANNPWLGLQAYGRKDAALFFGRERVVQEVLGRLLDPTRSPLLAVVGASGTGKSSVLRAGVLPRLEEPPEELAERTGTWTVARMPRLQGDPRLQLEEVLEKLAAAPAGRRKLLYVDQFEELYTQCPDGEARNGFLRRLRELVSGEEPLAVVLTLRSDFEPRLAGSEELGPLLATNRYLVPAMTSEEYREVIEEPAKAKALYFEPEALVGELVDEVMAMPGGLPLLSFALSEMYRQAQLRRRATGALDRALTRTDSAAAGGVVGALHRRANELYGAEDEAHRETIRRLFLRLVAQEGSRLARRRVERRELDYAEPAEQGRVERVLADYVQARLLVADEGHVEPAHDTLVLAWEKLLDWLAESGSQELLRQLWAAASAWEAARRERGDKRAVGLLWNQDPRLPLVQDRYLGRRQAERTPPDQAALAKLGDLNRLEREFAGRSASRKRHRRNLLAATTAAVVLVLSAATWYSMAQAAEARRSAAAERVARQRAQDTARVAVAGEWMTKDPTLSALVLLEVTNPEETGFAIPRLREALGLLAEVVLRAHTAPLLSAAFSPDGRRVVTGAEDSSARVWAADGSGRLAELSDSNEDLTIEKAIFCPDRSCASRVLTISDGGHVRLWDVGRRGDPVRLRDPAAPTASMIDAVFSPDGKRIVAGSIDGEVWIWATDRPEARLALLSGHERLVRRVAFSQDGGRFVTVSHDDTARVWAADSFASLPLTGHADDVVSGDFSPDGERVVTASRDGTARVWDAKTGDELDVLRHEDPVASALFSPDMGSRIVTISGDLVLIWTPGDDGRFRSKVLRGHRDDVVSAAFSPDGTQIVTASADGTARVWETYGLHMATVLAPSDAQDVVALHGHRGGVVSAAFSPDGKRIVTASRDGTARVWPAVRSAAREILDREHPLNPQSSAFRPDGTCAVTTGEQPGVVERRQGGLREVNVLCTGRDGRRIVTAANERTARVWAAGGFRELVALRGHEDVVTTAAFSPDGSRMVTGSGDRTARVWAADGSEIAVLREHQDTLRSTTFSPDGQRVVTSDATGIVRDWAVGGVLLQALVRAATAECLEADTRIDHLGESREQAAATYARCRRCIGPWRRRFAERDLRVEWKEAWSRWEQCMER